MTTEELETYLLKDSTRKTVKNKEYQAPSPDIIKFSTPYRARQSYGKAVKRVMKTLLTSPRKKIAVCSAGVTGEFPQGGIVLEPVKGLAEMVGMNIDDKISRYNYIVIQLLT